MGKMRWSLIVFCSLSLLQAQRFSNSIELDVNEAEFIDFSGISPFPVPRLNKVTPFIAGLYELDVYINNTKVINYSMEVKQSNSGMLPCIKKPFLNKVSLIRLDLIQEKLTSLNDLECLNLGELVDGAKVDLNLSKLRISISVPQRYIAVAKDRSVTSADNGINAGFLRYGFTTYSTDKGTNSFVAIDSGFNLAGWRLRQNGSFRTNSASTAYQSNSIYLQRDILAWNSNLSVGQLNTSGSLFPSVRFRGVQIATDDRMLPVYERNYLPVIRGFAKSNALVEFFQQGRLIFAETVSPGEFIFENYQAMTRDIEVVVTESDGTKHRFTVPFSTIPFLLKEGTRNYHLAVGTLETTNSSFSLTFLEGSYWQGVNPFLTLYGGSQLANNYQSVMVGFAMNTKIGAVGTDIKFSNVSGLPISSDDGANSNGQRLGLSYSSHIAATKSDFTLAAYQYRTRGFMELSEFNFLRNAAYEATSTFSTSSYKSEASRFQTNLSQPLDARSSLYLNATYRNFRNATSDRQYSFGFNHSFQLGINLSISLNQTKSEFSKLNDNFLQLGLSVPLGSGSSNVTTYYNREKEGSSLQTNLYGQFAPDHSGNYNVYAQMRTSGSSGRNDSYGASVGVSDMARNYQFATSGSASGGKQYSGGLNGALVFYSDGIIQTPRLSETFAIIESIGTPGVSLSSGDQIDSRGYGIVTNLRPYQENQIQLLPHTLADDVELKSTVSKVVPQAGSIGLLKFEAIRGELKYMRISSNVPVPAGADIYNSNNEAVGFVAQNQRVLLRGSVGDQFQIKWNDHECLLRFPANESSNEKSGYKQVTTVACE